MIIVTPGKVTGDQDYFGQFYYNISVGSMDPLLITHPLNALLIFGTAFGYGAWISARTGAGWGLFWIGGATFVLSQVGHLPFNIFLGYLFEQGILPQPTGDLQLPVTALVLGISSGIFEEPARYLAYRFWAKEARSWRGGLMLGAGHGGIEAAIVGALVLLAFFQLSSLRDADLAAIFPQAQLALAEQQVTAYWSARWYEPFFGVLERLLTIPVHLALSLMVLQCFTRRQPGWLFLAIGWHTLLNALAVYIASRWGALPAEAAIGLVSVASFGWIFALRTAETEPPPPDSAPQPAPRLLSDLPAQEITAQALERSRYN
jgi:uncharacterized membrane protein YhfC